MKTTLKLPDIPSDAHKYSRGSLLVLAGSRRYCGAGVLTTLAAEKTGAGYVTLATPASAALTARQHLLCSPVIEAFEDAELGSFFEAALPAILKEFRHISAICCGPGMTVNESTSAFVSDVLQYAAQKVIPLLLDADALNILAASPQLLDKREAATPLILTPHKGELARLYVAHIEGSGAEVGESKHAPILKVSVVDAAQALAEKLLAVIVAKGPTTYIAGGGEVFESNEGTAALAKAGTGDVLAGIISSLLAQGMVADEAALLGVKLHSRAGVLAEQKQGRRSVTALDVIDAIPAALAEFE